MRLVVIALLCVFGCSKREPLPADCSTVANGVKRYWADRAEVATEDDERAAIAETSKRAAERLERHCQTDRWSEEMIACARAVFRLDDSGCMKFLSAGQRARLEESEQPAPIPGGIGIGR
jgi:hypothetical protein